MKKFISPLLLIILLLSTMACEEEKTTNYFSITGKITAGETVSAEELLDIEIRLGLLNDTVNTLNISTKSNIVFEKIIKTPVDTEGSFTILNLDYGNYILKPESGYMFVPDTFIVVNIDGVHKREYLRKVEQIPNGFDWNW